MTSWTPAIISLLVATVLIQSVVAWWILARIQKLLDFSSLEGRAREFASTISLLGFIGYAFAVGMFGRNNPWKFVDVQPFRWFHDLAKRYLTDRPDIRWIYEWLWMIIAFVIPAMIFIVINAAIAGWVWEMLKKRRAGEFS